MHLYLSISSLQLELPSPTESFCTPKSCRSFQLRSSSLRWRFEQRTDSNTTQQSLFRWQPGMLQLRQKYIISEHNVDTLTTYEDDHTAKNFYLSLSSLQTGPTKAAGITVSLPNSSLTSSYFFTFVTSSGQYTPYSCG